VLSGELRWDGMSRQMAMNAIGGQLGGGVGRLNHQAVPPSRKVATVWGAKNAWEQFMYSLVCGSEPLIYNWFLTARRAERCRAADGASLAPLTGS
jgi:hypothetical protein